MGVAVLTRYALALALATTGTACVRPGAFRCASDTDCVLSGVQGRCEPVAYCSFPDPACADGNRFGDQSGSYAGTCAGAVDGIDARVDMTDAPPDAPGFAFSDHFSAAPSQWTVVSGTWGVVSGAYEQTTTAYGTMAVAGSGWSDLTVQASVVLHSGTDDLERVIFRFVDANNFAAGFITKFYGAVGIEQVIGGTRSFTQSAFTGVVGQAYVLKVVVSGSSAQIYVDGILKHSRTQPAGGPATGKIGLGTSAADVSFDDVLVTTP